MKTILYSIFAAFLTISCTSNSWEMAASSMEPTILRGDNISTESKDSINRKDIIAFRYNSPSLGEQTWVFRVIGVPGDKIEIRKGVLFLNDQPEKEPYIKLTKELLDSGTFQTGILGTAKETSWNMDNYGPLAIPRKGEIINDSLGSGDLYKNFADPGGKIKNDLFFVLGDSRHDAFDSRFIGFIPRSSIVGTVKRK